MKKRTITAAIVAAALGIGGALVVPLTASAHTGDMDVAAVCNTQTGEYDFTVTLTTARTDLAGSTLWRVGTESFQGTPSSAAGMDRGPVASSGAQTITLGTFSLPGTTTGLGPWVYAYTTWTDSYAQGSDDQLRERERLAGDCTTPPPPVDVCPNLDGAQDAIPEGYVLEDGACVLPPPPPVVEPCTTYSQVHTTDLAAWSWSDTRATGHYALTLNGLHIWTEGATSTDKVAGYYATSFPLAHLGTETIAQSIDYTAAFGLTPGLQLVLDADDDGTADGILVGEAVYGNAWWLSNSAAHFVKDGAPNTGGGYGSSWYGTPDEWLGAFPTARILAVGFSLGSGVHGDGVLNSITLGCVQYTFGLPVPQIPEPRVVVTYGEFGGDEPTCETPTVTWTRTATTTTTPWKVVVVEGAYQVVEDTENATSVTVTDEQTEVHEYDGDCTPPPTEPPASTPPVVELGHTGVSAAETLFLVLAGIALLALGAVALLAARIRRQQ